jgi:hypothetical protein
MAKTKRYSPEARDRAVRMVFDHASEYGSQWEAIRSIASKIGCTGETLRTWVRKSEVDTGRRAGVPTEERVRFDHCGVRTDWLKPGSKYLWVGSVMPTTMRWPRRLSVSLKQK